MMTPKEKIERQAILTVAHHDYGKALNVRAFFKIHNRATSEDLVQETFMKTWVYLVKGGKINTMKSFLYHILNHLIIDEYRKHKNTSLDTLLEKGFEPSVVNSENIFNTLDGKAMFLLIKHLPRTYQKVIRMKYVQDLTIKEISLITGQTKNAITVQIHRGLKKLRLLYSPV